MKLSIGEVFAEAWRLYTRSAGRLVTIGAIVFGALALVQIAVASSGNRWIALVTLIPFSVGVYWLQGALAVATHELRQQRLELSPGEIFGRVRPFLPRLILAGILIALVVGGLVALVFLISAVPAAIVLVLLFLVLSALWIGVTPAIVLENRGVIASFRRSHALVRGDLVRVLAIVVVSLVFASIVAAVIRALFTPLPSPASLYLGDLVANSVTVPFVSLTWTLAFLDLRLNKEGPWTRKT